MHFSFFHLRFFALLSNVEPSRHRPRFHLSLFLVQMPPGFLTFRVLQRFLEEHHCRRSVVEVGVCLKMKHDLG